MTDSTILNVVSAQTVTSVQLVTISNITTDANNNPVRTIRVYGLPAGTQGTPVLTLNLSTDVANNLLISTPAATF